MVGSFFDPNFAALGGQMAQAWQKALETWWDGLLGDRAKLEELARKLQNISPKKTATGASATDVADIGRIIEALELIENRQAALEKRVGALAENLAAVVTFLERTGSESPSAPPDEPAPGGDE